MNNFSKLKKIAGSWQVFALAGFFLTAGLARASLDQTFDVFQVGAQTYRNVTVTTKAKKYIFILHSKGMANIKVADLSPELREQLGYVDPTPQVKTNAASAWAKQTMAKIGSPQLKAVEDQVQETWRQNLSFSWLEDPKGIIVISGAFLLCYLFFCYCCHLICTKAGNPPSALIWFPIFKVFPLLRAANMSSWWFLALLVPILNLVASIVWAVRIVQARSKSAWVTLMLLLPVTNFLAFLYLAFSDAPEPERKERRVIQIMTLDAA